MFVGFVERFHMRGEYQYRTFIGVISNVLRAKTCLKSLLVGSHDVCQCFSDNQLTSPWALVVLPSCYVGNVKVKSGKAFS